MGDYLDKNKPLGKNVKHLLAYAVSRLAIPDGGGVGAAMNFLTDAKRQREITHAAMEWVEEAIAAVKSSPDNPYGDDDEAIAGEIVRQADERRGT